MSKPETLFDTVTILETSILDSVQLTDICKSQQFMTMQRIANWLRNNACIYTIENEVTIAKQIISLADELDYLATLAKDKPYRISHK